MKNLYRYDIDFDQQETGYLHKFLPEQDMHLPLERPPQKILEKENPLVTALRKLTGWQQLNALQS